MSDVYYDPLFGVAGMLLATSEVSKEAKNFLSMTPKDVVSSVSALANPRTELLRGILTYGVKTATVYQSLKYGQSITDVVYN